MNHIRIQLTIQFSENSDFWHVPYVTKQVDVTLPEVLLVPEAFTKMVMSALKDAKEEYPAVQSAFLLKAHEEALEEDRRRTEN